ncbi:DUF6193 family natural product biosynthesis protein [Streptomyces sp. NPDC057302]|uniref:DUF6193 family natural product biosynthesis protein n=1 Tax=Streptomyces sp. NPDC057302 TaxID=3346094 RepID=UPI00363008D0
MPIPPDPADLYPDIAVYGSLRAALHAASEGRLSSTSMRFSESEPLDHVAVDCSLPYRNSLLISAWVHERRWSIRGTDSFQELALVGGKTEDLMEVAAAALAWHNGEPLDAIQQAAPFVHLSGRFEVPDLDPARLTASEWQHLRTEASELEYPWGPAYQALVEAAHAEPALRRLYPFTSHWALRFSTTTRPSLTVVGPMLSARSIDHYTVSRTLTGDEGAQFSAPADAVAAAVRELPLGLASVTLGDTEMRRR